MGLIESLKSGDWEHDSYTATEDYAVLPLFALFFPIVRFLLDTFVFETRRSDIGVSMAHHVVTVALIALSYIYTGLLELVRWFWPSMMRVMKMSNYTGAEGLASPAFVLSWILLRLIYYPFWILPLEHKVLLTLDRAKHERDGPIYYYTFNTLLYCLFFLHVYWWVLIYRMLVKQIQARGRLSDDVRSDSDTDNEHED